MPNIVLSAAIQQVSSGRYGVGVSGGADSVALLLLLRQRPDLSLHVIHLDHQTRGQASTGDAAFVADLAMQLSVPCTLARRDEIERALIDRGVTDLPNNPSARYRALRLELFRQVAKWENLAGIILAHHADDQAETILFRLLRGAGPTGLCGMRLRGRVNDLVVLRPLLGVRRDELRRFLHRRGQGWREDASNQSDRYARNRIRKWLRSRPRLVTPLLNLAQSSQSYCRWLRQSAPRLAGKFPARQLADLPRPLAQESSRQWLIAAGASRALLAPAVLDRLIHMATDAASPPRQQFPGNITVHRRSGWISRDESRQSG